MDPRPVKPLPFRAVRARAFGTSIADLAIDFAAADRAQAVTELLAGVLDDGGKPVPADEIWDWTLNRRLQAMLAVRLASTDPHASLAVTCRSCLEAMEVDLDLAALVSPPASPALAWCSTEDHEVNLRLPRGRDQQVWIHAGTGDPTAILAALVESIGGRSPEPSFLPPPAWLGPAGDALEALDPLTTLTLQARCPACDHDNVIDFDLELFLLRGFADIQGRLIEDVGRLAAAFHWREADIVALPPWRRVRYLQKFYAGGVS